MRIDILASIENEQRVLSSLRASCPEMPVSEESARIRSAVLSVDRAFEFGTDRKKGFREGTGRYLRARAKHDAMNAPRRRRAEIRAVASVHRNCSEAENLFQAAMREHTDKVERQKMIIWQLYDDLRCCERELLAPELIALARDLPPFPGESVFKSDGITLLRGSLMRRNLVHPDDMDCWVDQPSSLDDEYLYFAGKDLPPEQSIDLARQAALEGLPGCAGTEGERSRDAVIMVLKITRSAYCTALKANDVLPPIRCTETVVAKSFLRSCFSRLSFYRVEE